MNQKNNENAMLELKSTIISTYLKPYTSKLNELYEWKFNTDKLSKFLTVEEISELDKCEDNTYIKEVLLKNHLSGYLNNELNKSTNPTNNFKDICDWIVKEWGGIKSGDLKVDDELIKNIKNSNLPFERIASYSKIASFLNPSKQIIYDSRVAYSINWILLSSNQIDTGFFPIPEGRNSKLIAFDMNVLIHLTLKDKFYESIQDLTHKNYINSVDKVLYLSKNKSYFYLNELINLVHKKLWGENDTELFKTEMLLFSIADNHIISDIIQKTTISIQN